MSPPLPTLGIATKNIYLNKYMYGQRALLYTRLLGRFAPIFYLNWFFFGLHFKTKKKRIFGFKKKFKDFQEFNFFLQN